MLYRLGAVCAMVFMVSLSYGGGHVRTLRHIDVNSSFGDDAVVDGERIAVRCHDRVLVFHGQNDLTWDIPLPEAHRFTGVGDQTVVLWGDYVVYSVPAENKACMVKIETGELVREFVRSEPPSLLYRGGFGFAIARSGDKLFVYDWSVNFDAYNNYSEGLIECYDLNSGQHLWRSTNPSMGASLIPRFIVRNLEVIAPLAFSQSMQSAEFLRVLVETGGIVGIVRRPDVVQGNAPFGTSFGANSESFFVGQGGTLYGGGLLVLDNSGSVTKAVRSPDVWRIGYTLVADNRHVFSGDGSFYTADPSEPSIAAFDAKTMKQTGSIFPPESALRFGEKLYLGPSFLAVKGMEQIAETHWLQGVLYIYPRDIFDRVTAAQGWECFE